MRHSRAIVSMEASVSDLWWKRFRQERNAGEEIKPSDEVTARNVSNDLQSMRIPPCRTKTLDAIVQIEKTDSLGAAVEMDHSPGLREHHSSMKHLVDSQDVEDLIDSEKLENEGNEIRVVENDFPRTAEKRDD